MNIDPTPYLPDIAPRATPHAKKGHRPRMGKHLRIIMSGASVDVATNAQIERWMKGAKPAAKLSRGIVIDQLTTHGKRTAFKPKTKL